MIDWGNLLKNIRGNNGLGNKTVGHSGPNFTDKMCFVIEYLFHPCPYDWMSVPMTRNTWVVIARSKKGFKLLKRCRVTFVPVAEMYAFISKISFVTSPEDGGIGVSLGDYSGPAPAVNIEQ